MPLLPLPTLPGLLPMAHMFFASHRHQVMAILRAALLFISPLPASAKPCALHVTDTQWMINLKVSFLNQDLFSSFEEYDFSSKELFLFLKRIAMIQVQSHHCQNIISTVQSIFQLQSTSLFS